MAETGGEQDVPHAGSAAKPPEGRPTRGTSISVVVPGAADKAHAYHRFSHLKLSEFLSGVDSVTRPRGFNVVLQIADSGVPLDPRHRNLWDSAEVGGVLWLAQPFPADMERPSSPMVSMNVAPRLDLVVSAVNTDVYSGTRLAISHLVSMGHERIAYVAGPAEFWVSSERRRGYIDAMTAADLAQTITEGDFFEDSGVKSVERIWTTSSSPPTAIVTGGDLMALGVIRGLSKIGLSVPDDVAVIGSDGIDLAPYIDPPLTTVLSNFFQAARRATDLLLDEITSPGHKHEETIFPTELLVRRSCGYFADRPGVPTEVAVSNLDELVGIAGRRPLGSLL